MTCPPLPAKGRESNPLHLQTTSAEGRSATSGSRLFIKQRSAASCCHPLQRNWFPRPARIVGAAIAMSSPRSGNAAEHSRRFRITIHLYDTAARAGIVHVVFEARALRVWNSSSAISELYGFCTFFFPNLVQSPRFPLPLAIHVAKIASNDVDCVGIPRCRGK